ncbi:MAG: amidohydrolase [Acidimicrobiales bacterium]|jgi:predicted TIM-barrel fold metal-dependent hydrolase|nr:amidohydrolase [Acidimicrobiales bacterium]
MTVPEQATAATTGELPKIISVDDHVIEPGDVWLNRLPARYHDVAPRIERKRVKNLAFNGTTYTYDLDPEGKETDFWAYEDLIVPHRRIIAAVGFPKDEVTLTPITYEEMRPGCYDQQARLEDMDLNWTEASLSFPTFPRFCGQTFLEAKDRELAALCVRAYNDWMVEEWSANTDGRLIPLCIVPLWDAQEAAAEVRRNADRGVRAVCFSEIPYHLGLPSVHDKDRFWEPFFQACAETQTVVCMHIGSSSKMPATSPDAPASVQATLSFNNAMGSMSDFFFSGVLVRHPDLKLAYSEGQIGWIPYILERADDVWSQFRGWAFDRSLVPEPPSTYYYRQIYGCFFRDSHGLRSLEEVGEDNITFETDYPHSDSTWPDTREIAEKMFAGLTGEQIYKITRGNAIRMLGLDLDR